MSLQIFNSRILAVSQRFAGLILNRTYAKPGKSFQKQICFNWMNFKLIFNIVVKKAKVGKSGPIIEKPTLYVEKDPQKLVNYVCGSNIYNEGEDIPVSLF